MVWKSCFFNLSLSENVYFSFLPPCRLSNWYNNEYGQRIHYEFKRWPLPSNMNYYTIVVNYYEDDMLSFLLRVVLFEWGRGTITERNGDIPNHRCLFLTPQNVKKIIGLWPGRIQSEEMITIKWSGFNDLGFLARYFAYSWTNCGMKIKLISIGGRPTR
jgi:hypothetical protein